MKKWVMIVLMIYCSMSFANSQAIQPGAMQMEQYLPLLQDKRVGVFANHSSQIGDQHLVDELIRHHIQVKKVFAPEHGFRGDKDDGEKIHDTNDPKTGVPIVSLYGKKLAPSSEDLKDIDILLFDIQDVGVRFYTYISSLQKLMEAAIKNNKPLIILDRPNPNGFYVDGPVLELKYKSFTGMQPIPIVYGMTIAEYAKMLIGEEWLEVSPKSKAKQLKLFIVPNVNYDHRSLYEPPVKPSPNLPFIQSIYLYPSIGIMEATALSVGRGTPHPFQWFGHPLLKTAFTFIPIPREGAMTPRFQHQVCHGWDLSASKEVTLTKINRQIQLHYLIKAYQLFPEKDRFFSKSFNYAVGNSLLKKQIIAQTEEALIRQSWEPKLEAFKKIRKKYLIYPDFDPT